MEGLAVGERVMGGCRFGGYAELVVTGASALVPLPDEWSYAEGAAMPVTYATAYAALIRYGSLHAGERVLIQAAAGGVGIAATQIAKLVGAEVYGTASPAKHAAIRSFGVDHPIDYRGQRRRQGGAPDRGREAAARPGARRGRRAQLPQELLAAAARRAAGLLRRVGGPVRRAAQAAAGAAHAGARCRATTCCA